MDHANCVDRRRCFHLLFECRFKSLAVRRACALVWPVVGLHQTRARRRSGVLTRTHRMSECPIWIERGHSVRVVEGDPVYCRNRHQRRTIVTTMTTANPQIGTEPMPNATRPIVSAAPDVGIDKPPVETAKWRAPGPNAIQLNSTASEETMTTASRS